MQFYFWRNLFMVRLLSNGCTRYMKTKYITPCKQHEACVSLWLEYFGVPHVLPHQHNWPWWRHQMKTFSALLAFLWRESTGLWSDVCARTLTATYYLCCDRLRLYRNIIQFAHDTLCVLWLVEIISRNNLIMSRSICRALTQTANHTGHRWILFTKASDAEL